MSDPASKNPLPLHPVFFAAFPVASLLGQNLDVLPLLEVGRALGVILLITAIVWGSLGLLIRNSRPAAAIASAFLLVFFTYDQWMTSRADGPDDVLLDIQLGIVAAIFVVAAIGIARAKTSWRGPTIFLNVVSIAAIAMPSFNVVQYLATRDSAASAEVDTAEFGALQGEVWAAVTPEMVASQKTRPDIYYIMLDAYARHDVLEQYYGYDNAPFLDFLEDQGFFVAREARANYNQTLLCLSAVLNLFYLDWALPPKDADAHETALFSRSKAADVPGSIKKSEVLRFLQHYGYSSVALSTGFHLTELTEADRFIEPGLLLNEFENVLLRNTPLPHVVGRLSSEPPLDAMQRRRILFNFETLTKLSTSRSPKFVFAHFLSPHPPFVFDREGEPPDPPYETNGFGTGNMVIGVTIERERFQQGYVDQLHYVTSQLRRTIERIREQSPDAIIVVQSDHGPSSMTDWWDMKKTNTHERLSVLNAIYLPNGDYAGLPQTLSPVNTFRIVFDRYFGIDLPLLPDRSFTSPFTKLTGAEEVFFDQPAPETR